MQPGEPHYSKYLKKLVYGAARCFPLRPGNGIDAATLCETLAVYGIPSTLGKLSKAGDDPAGIVHEYRTASNALKSAGDLFYLSVKPPALAFDPGHAASIVDAALQNGHSVHFDAHGFPYTGQTLELLQDVMERFPPLASRNWTYGLTLPSRWKRSAADARWVVKNAVRPRLVKGDFKAASSHEVEPVAGFLALVDQLAGEVPELAVATHDAVLAREAAARCSKKGTALQFELFFGMPSGSMIALAREIDVPLRFYVPYGDTLIVYLIRDLITNPGKLLRRSSLEILGSQEAKLARIIGAV